MKGICGDTQGIRYILGSGRFSIADYQSVYRYHLHYEEEG